MYFLEKEKQKQTTQKTPRGIGIGLVAKINKELVLGKPRIVDEQCYLHAISQIVGLTFQEFGTQSRLMSKASKTNQC